MGQERSRRRVVSCGFPERPWTWFKSCHLVRIYDLLNQGWSWEKNRNNIIWHNMIYLDLPFCANFCEIFCRNSFKNDTPKAEILHIMALCKIQEDEKTRLPIGVAFMHITSRQKRPENSCRFESPGSLFCPENPAWKWQKIYGKS